MLDRGAILHRVERTSPALLVLEGGLGTGKTALASAVARRSIDSGDSSIWLEFEAGETGAQSFWSRVHCAFRGDEAQDAAPAIDAPLAWEAAPADFRSIRNELGAAAGDHCLVLDELHLVYDDEVGNSLISFLETFTHWKAVVTTQVELPGLSGIDARVRVPVLHLTSDDLAFTEDEIAALISVRTQADSPDRTPLSSAQVYHATKGWPLAAHAYIEEWRAGSTPDALERGSEWIRSFITRSVATWDDHVRSVVGALALVIAAPTSVLARMLNQPEESIAQALSSAAFPYLTYRMDAQGVRWYRFPEAVRRELLRDVEARTPPDDLRSRYRRAALALAPFDRLEALRAAIRGEAWDALSELLLTGPISDLVGEPEDHPRSMLLRRIPLEVRKKYPVIYAYAAFQAYAYPDGQFEEILQELRMLSGPWLAEASKRPGLPGLYTAMLRMIAARLCGDEALGRAAAKRNSQSLSDLSEQESELISTKIPNIYLQQAITYLHGHHFADAEDALGQMQAFESRSRPIEQAHRISLQALILAVRGQIPDSRRHLELADSLILPVGWRTSYAGSGFRIATALCSLESDDTDSAEHQMREMRRHWLKIEYWPYLVMISALLEERHHDASTALDYLNQELEFRSSRFPAAPSLQAELDGLRGRLEYISGKHGQLSPARRASSLADLYALIGRNERNRSRALVSRLLSLPGYLHHPRRHVELLLLQAHLAHLDGDADLAGNATKLAYRRASSNELALPYRTLTSEALAQLTVYQPLLDPSDGAAGSAAQRTPLSEAEMRALAAVARHGSTPRAAESLFLSRHTVRNQLTTAYRKLGAHSFDDALRRL